MFLRMAKNKPFGNCTITTNGVECGARHNSLLHGTTSKFCNLAQVHTSRGQLGPSRPTMDEVMRTKNPYTLMQLQWLKCVDNVNHAESCLLFDPSYPLGVEVLGRVPGGRWAVRLAGLEDNLDVGELLLEAGLARRREDLMAMVETKEKEMNEPTKKPSMTPLSEKLQQAVTTASNEVKLEPRLETACETSSDVKPATDLKVPDVPTNKFTESEQDPIQTKPEAAVGPQPTLLKSEPSKSVPSKPAADQVGETEQNTNRKKNVQAELAKDSEELSSGKLGEEQITPKKTAISRGTLPPNTTKLLADITHLRSPSHLHFCPADQADLFLDIMATTQSPKERPVVAELGAACLVKADDGIFYRAEVTELGPETITVFLLDDGRSLEVGLEELRPLDGRLEPGLVVLAALAGLRPKSEVWSLEEVDAANLLLGVGGETHMEVEVVAEVEGVPQVRIRDCEGNDVVELMLEAKIGLPSDTLTYGTLMVFAANSPVDIYLSSLEMFSEYQEKIHPVVPEAGEKGGVVATVTRSARVVAWDGEAWYRAEVRNILPQDKVEVFLLDLGSSLQVEARDLRRTSPDLFFPPVTSVPACLAGWEQEDRAKVAEKWGSRMEELVPEMFCDLEVEVVGNSVSPVRYSVNVASWEGSLGRKKEKQSKATMLMARLKAK